MKELIICGDDCRCRDNDDDDDDDDEDDDDNDDDDDDDDGNDDNDDDDDACNDINTLSTDNHHPFVLLFLSLFGYDCKRHVTHNLFLVQPPLAAILLCQSATTPDWLSFKSFSVHLVQNL